MNVKDVDYSNATKLLIKALDELENSYLIFKNILFLIFNVAKD